MVIGVDGEASWLFVISAASLISGVMIVSCVTCRCWGRFVKKDITDDEYCRDEGEVYTNPSFDDAPQKTAAETKRKKFGSSVVTNSPNNSIEPYQEVAEGVVLQNRFTNDKKENKPNEFGVKNRDVKVAKAADEKSDTELISQSENSFSSNAMSMTTDAVSNSSTIVVSVEVHCTGVKNGQLGTSSQPGSTSCSPKQHSILESHAMDNELSFNMDRNGDAVHINPFTVERLEGNMKNSLHNSPMSIAL